MKEHVYTERKRQRQSSHGGNLAPPLGDMWQCLKILFTTTERGEILTSSWGGGRNAAKHSVVHRAALTSADVSSV